MENELREIFLKRQQLDVSRQPRRSRSYSQLVQSASLRKLEHPYSSQFFKPTPESPPEGLPARPPSHYCYRITSIGSLAKSTGSLRIKKTETDARNWELLKEASGRPRSWVRLSKLATGKLRGWRGFTWWTPSTLEIEDLITSAYQLGINNENIPKRGAILRCPVDHLLRNRLVTVPTIIEGFDQLIFMATKDSDKPAMGVTIDINTKTFSFGVGEVCLAAVPVAEIECLPVHIFEREKEPDKYREELLKPLGSYYDQQLRPGH